MSSQSSFQAVLASSCQMRAVCSLPESAAERDLECMCSKDVLGIVNPV